MLSFTPNGTLTLYADLDGSVEHVATLNLLSGDGLILNNNGLITLEYEFTDLEEGYFFWADDTDMAINTNQVLCLTTTNAIKTDYMDPELQAYLTDSGATYNDADDSLDELLLSAGQIQLTRAVPVPSALLLLGSGLIGLVGFRRKNN
ncbi:PEP-CTERM sorting domain-containing protein [Desulfobacter curvatus]|uniref:PEP-CTERM sorting domain-containing protein n=1 Tax=Desulfobacter curvatus TaxID=2290 RepID=UPI00035C4602|nr:PEP-CTERM sorting domain-containing protein [Desulfobacter curvatus]